MAKTVSIEIKDRQGKIMNYTAHAIEDLKIFADKLRFNAPLSSEVTFEMIDIMRKSPKFILPDYGSLIYDMNSLPTGIGLTRLPFPKIVLEVPYPEKINNHNLVVESTKRLIIAEEGICGVPGDSHEKLGFREARHMEIPNGVRISVCSYYDHEKAWFLQGTSAIVKMGMLSIASEDIDDDIRGTDEDPYKENRISNVAFPFYPWPLLPEMDKEAVNRLGMLGYKQMVSNDIGTEIRILVEMLMVLACKNVSTEVAQPQEKLNRARIKKGKEPFHAYHILTVGNSPLYSGKSSAYQPGDEYKVRQHLRRGHIRRIAEDHTIWVNQTVVAAGSQKGLTAKDYKVKSRR